MRSGPVAAVAQCSTPYRYLHLFFRRVSVSPCEKTLCCGDRGNDVRQRTAIEGCSRMVPGALAIVSGTRVIVAAAQRAGHAFPRGEIVQVLSKWPENHDLVGWAKRSVPNNQ